MKKSNSQLEKNTTASFAYVKKDILMLNDAFSDLFDKMQKLSSRIETIEEAAKKPKKKVVKRRR
tara:strand:- start:24 stop:215 length:192 start_codon:yes stop_codon:yes gene_type:complete